MYEKYFELAEIPFRIISDPRFLWYSEQHQSAKEKIVYHITQSVGPIYLLADIGTPANIQFVPHIVGPRFFTVPQLGRIVDEPILKAHLITPEVPKQHPTKGKTAMRYAAYVRISSEEQVGNFSVDAQKRAITDWVKQQEGRLVKVYVDEAQ